MIRRRAPMLDSASANNVSWGSMQVMDMKLDKGTS